MLNFRNGLLVMFGTGLVSSQTIAALAQEPTTESSLTPEAQTLANAAELGQTLGAAAFRGVSPNDWAFQALDDLVLRYDCIQGYPDGTFRGDQAVTRDEFAAGLNACLQRIETLITESAVNPEPPEEVSNLDRQVQDLEAQLEALRDRIGGVEE